MRADIGEMTVIGILVFWFRWSMATDWRRISAAEH